MIEWIRPGARPGLADDEVHVWRVGLELPAGRVDALYATLSADEQARAARFRFPRDRDHFIAARGVLRAILAGHLGVAPAAVRFRYGEFGRPYLDDGSVGVWEYGSTGGRHPASHTPTPPHSHLATLPHSHPPTHPHSLTPISPHSHTPIRFNVSHSGGLALIALTRGRELGVDVERVRPDFAEEAVAERFFSAREAAELRALPPEERPLAFFRCWTRKEAFVKATGLGLSLPLDEFDVSLAPGEPAALRCTRWDPAEASRWSLVGLDPGPGCAAALAVEGSDWVLRRFQEELPGHDHLQLA